MEPITAYIAVETKGDPGLAAFGVSVTLPAQSEVLEYGQVIGNATSRYATYQAVLSLLELIVREVSSLAASDVVVYLESAAVVGELNHELPVEDPAFVPLFIAVHNLRVEQGLKVRFALIEARKNVVAAMLAKRALDA